MQISQADLEKVVDALKYSKQALCLWRSKFLVNENPHTCDQAIQLNAGAIELLATLQPVQDGWKTKDCPNNCIKTNAYMYQGPSGRWHACLIHDPDHKECEICHEHHIKGEKHAPWD